MTFLFRESINLPILNINSRVAAGGRRPAVPVSPARPRSRRHPAHDRRRPAPLPLLPARGVRRLVPPRRPPRLLDGPCPGPGARLAQAGAAALASGCPRLPGAVPALRRAQDSLGHPPGLPGGRLPGRPACASVAPAGGRRAAGSAAWRERPPSRCSRLRLPGACAPGGHAARCARSRPRPFSRAWILRHARRVGRWRVRRRVRRGVRRAAVPRSALE